MKLLITDADFENAVWFGQEVFVYLGGELVDRGTIEGYSSASVKLNGGRFLRTNCSFWAANTI